MVIKPSSLTSSNADNAPAVMTADEPVKSESLPGAQAASLSLIIPLYNEEENVPALYEKLTQSMSSLNRPYELVLVDDGSADRTLQLLQGIAEKDSHVVVLALARNLGQTAAMTAGLDFARNEVIICMDGDLQNDPADIKNVLSKLDEGYDVVCGWRKDRQDPFHRVLPSRIANSIISRISGVRLHDFGCTLKAFRRNTVKSVRLYGEMHRFIPIYASWQGARIVEVPVNHHPRTRGKSNYGLERTFKVILDLIVVQFLSSYVTKPIYVFGTFGFVSLLLSMLAGAAAFFFKLMPLNGGYHKDLIQTPLPVLAVGLFVIGVQTVLIGLLAEIQVRTYYESQRKPIYTLKVLPPPGAQKK